MVEVRDPNATIEYISTRIDTKNLTRFIIGFIPSDKALKVWFEIFTEEGVIDTNEFSKNIINILMAGLRGIKGLRLPNTGEIRDYDEVTSDLLMMLPLGVLVELAIVIIRNNLSLDNATTTQDIHASFIGKWKKDLRETCEDFKKRWAPIERAWKKMTNKEALDDRTKPE